MNTLLEWMAQGHLAPQDPEALARRHGLLPGVARWQHALDRTLLLAGATGVGVGVLFLVAANLDHLSSFARFAGVQAMLALAVLGYLRWQDRPAGRVALALAALLIGVLLALYGQTYQTGADPWQLFAGWAAFALPWIALINHGAAWLAWLLLVDLAVARAMQVGVLPGPFDDPGESLCWVLFLWHGAALAAAEWLRTRHPLAWGGGLRLALWAGVLMPSTLLSMHWVLERPIGPPVHLLPWALSLAAGYAWYRRRHLRIAQLAALALSVIAVATALLGRWLAEMRDVGVWLLLALTVVVMTGIAGRWLISLARAQRQ